MEPPPSDTPREPETDNAEATGSRMRQIRLAVWAAFAAGLLLFIAFGSVSAISYTYYSFSGRLVRNSPNRSLTDIWRDAVAAMPDFSAGWVPGAILVACLAITVLCVIAGAWMLLVQAPEPRRRTSTAE
jgi:hypothetical protein